DRGRRSGRLRGAGRAADRPAAVAHAGRTADRLAADRCHPGGRSRCGLADAVPGGSAGGHRHRRCGWTVPALPARAHEPEGDPVMTDTLVTVPGAAAAHQLGAEDIRLGYGDRIVVDGLSLDIEPGVVTTVIGPNGCGKSTLLRSLGRLLRPSGGRVVLDGKAISSMKTK